jgi:hypothetical protein
MKLQPIRIPSVTYYEIKTRMTRRSLLRIAPSLLIPSRITAAPCVSNLDPRTSAGYDAYLEKARLAVEKPLATPLERVPDSLRADAQRAIDNRQAYVWNLHADEPTRALAVFKGIIVDWLGVVRIPDATLDTFQSVLSQYDSYSKWYTPYIFNCYARPTQGPGEKNFLVTSILHDVVQKPGPMLPDQHFSFEVNAEANYFRLGSADSPTLMIRTHATSIREASSGHPEHADSRYKNDLMPPARGQGVLWRSDTWWRAIPAKGGIYAEYESLSLARSLDSLELFSLCSLLRLPGLKEKALESMSERPRKTVTAVLQDTRSACEKLSVANRSAAF